MRALALLLAGCVYDVGVVPPGDDDPDDTEDPDTEDPDTEDPDTDTEAIRPGQDEDHPRPPAYGEVVLTELMIDPSAVDDAVGEWVEVRSATDDWLDLTELALADENLDLARVEPTGRDLVLGPGRALVLCAQASGNGGVDCDATYTYGTLGGGFALSNTTDEVRLVADGATLDRFAYGEGFAVRGASLGLDPDRTDAYDNDASNAWCPQEEPLPGGDRGTPGDENEPC